MSAFSEMLLSRYSKGEENWSKYEIDLVVVVRECKSVMPEMRSVRGGGSGGVKWGV